MSWRRINTIHLVRHLPTVHGLLVLLACFEDEDVDGLAVRDVFVRLELLAEAVSDVRWGEVAFARGCFQIPIATSASTHGRGVFNIFKGERYQSRACDRQQTAEWLRAMLLALTPSEAR